MPPKKQAAGKETKIHQTDIKGQDPEQCVMPYGIDFTIDIESTDVIATTAVLSIGAVGCMRASSEIDRDDAPYSRRNQDIGAFIGTLFSASSGESPDDVAVPVASSEPTMLFSATAPLAEQVLDGRTVYSDTQNWWASQSHSAKAAVLSPHAAAKITYHAGSNRVVYSQFSMHNVLCALRDAMSDYILAVAQHYNLNTYDRSVMSELRSRVRVFCRGSQFDVAAVETLYAKYLNIRPAVRAGQAFEDGNIWHFRSVFDVRSYLAGIMFASGIKDSAIEDAAKEGKFQINKAIQAATGNPDHAKYGVSHVALYDAAIDSNRVYVAECLCDKSAQEK